MSLRVFGDLSLEELSLAIKSTFPYKTIRVAEEGEDIKVDLYKPVKDSVVVMLDGNIPDSSAISSIDYKMKLEATERQLKELEHNAIKSHSTIQALHKQQHTLFDEFVLLRQKYDEQKAVLINTLWVNCGQHHPELKSIPSVEDENTFIEQEDRVGNYIVGNVLGEGQFAVVRNCWKADDEEKEFALKIIKKERVATYNSLKRVSNEIEILSKLHDKSVVYIQEVFQTQSKLYMITEKGGKDLFEFFDEHPDGVSEAWAKDIMINIMKGVHYCHENMVCHRDLKPENILLEFDVSTGRCINLKLCDFGLSTVFNPKVLLTDFCGSPGFFAPEMIIHGSYFGDKADIWSVGCILLELILGHERFCDAWIVAYDYNILQDKKAFATEINRVVSKLPEVLHFGHLLNDFIIQSLQIRSSDRANTTFLCLHRWLDALLDYLFESSNDKDDEEKSQDVTLVRSPSQFSTSPLQNALEGSGVAMLGKQAYQDALKDLYVDVRERKQITEDHEGIHLPPIEPSTPSLSKARKIVTSGDELALRASSGTILRSPKNKQADVAALPGLLEDDNEDGDSGKYVHGHGHGKKDISSGAAATRSANSGEGEGDVFILQDRKSPRS